MMKTMLFVHAARQKAEKQVKVLWSFVCWLISCGGLDCVLLLSAQAEVEEVLCCILHDLQRDHFFSFSQNNKS
jgi:hypothetical protein